MINKIINWYQNKGAYYLKYALPFSNYGCRFYPTCSEYSRVSIKKHGLMRGSLKSLWRIIRCNPLSKGGQDLP